MSTGARINRTVRSWGAVGACTLALTLAGCSSQVAARGAAVAPEPSVAASTPAATPTRTAAPTPTPDPAALTGVRINIADGQTVGVGMPISLAFDRPVPSAERAAVEGALTVRTSSGAVGAWSWIKDRNLLGGQRVDYRPQRPWAPGTVVTVQVGSGTTRHFTIGRSLVATVNVKTHYMTVVKGGASRRIAITAGRPGMDTWNGTMVVSDKQRRVLMDSRTVGFGDAYKGYYDYAVHLTASGTYLHQNPKADTYGGLQNVTHGCVGLADDGTAQAFFNEVIPGDIVTVVGSKDTVAAGNGYGDWNMTWSQWLAGSALHR